jgi:hypothetical protein
LFKGCTIIASGQWKRINFRLARIASQAGFRALLAMTVEPFGGVRKTKHTKAQWIPACAGMTVHTGNDNLRWQRKEMLNIA